MSPIQVTALGVRLFAIWLAIYWARWGPYLYNEARDSEGLSASVAAVIVGVLAVGFVLFLWFFPRTVARTLLPKGDATPPTSVAPASWFTVGCALLGLWVLTTAVPALVQQGYLALYVERNNMPLPERWGSSVIYYVVELGIGIWLLFGAAGVRKVLWWARNGRFG